MTAVLASIHPNVVQSQPAEETQIHPLQFNSGLGNKRSDQGRGPQTSYSPSPQLPEATAPQGALTPNTVEPQKWTGRGHTFLLWIKNFRDRTYTRDQAPVNSVGVYAPKIRQPHSGCGTEG